MELNERLKAWRARAGLTQVTAAAALGLPVGTLRAIEQGRKFVHERLLILAIEALESRHGA